MTTLVPGSLFQASGLNRSSTPTGELYASEEQHHEEDPPVLQSQRQLPVPGPVTLQAPPLNGQVSSSVPGVYDVANSSSGLILLNNRFKPQKFSHLRGHSPLLQDMHDLRTPDPDRHFVVHPHLNATCQEMQESARDSRAQPAQRRPLFSRPLSRRELFESRVNSGHHISCSVPTNPDSYSGQLFGPQQPARKSLRRSMPNQVASLADERLMTRGQAYYMGSIWHVYNLDHMRQIKRRQYKEKGLPDADKRFRTPKPLNRPQIPKRVLPKHGFASRLKKEKPVLHSSYPKDEPKIIVYKQREAVKKPSDRINGDRNVEYSSFSREGVTRPKSRLGHVKSHDIADVEHPHIAHTALTDKGLDASAPHVKREDGQNALLLPAVAEKTGIKKEVDTTATIADLLNIHNAGDMASDDEDDYDDKSVISKIDHEYALKSPSSSTESSLIFPDKNSAEMKNTDFTDLDVSYTAEGQEEAVEATQSELMEATIIKSAGSSSSSSITSFSSFHQHATGVLDVEDGSIKSVDMKDEGNSKQAGQEVTQVALQDHGNLSANSGNVGESIAMTEQSPKNQELDDSLTYDDHEQSVGPGNGPRSGIPVSEQTEVLNESNWPFVPEISLSSVEELPNEDATKLVTVDNDQEVGEEIRIADAGKNETLIKTGDAFNPRNKEEQAQSTENADDNKIIMDEPPEAPEMSKINEEFQKPEDQSPETNTDDLIGTMDQRTDNEDITIDGVVVVADQRRGHDYVVSALDHSAELTTNDIVGVLAPEPEQSVPESDDIDSTGYHMNESEISTNYIGHQKNEGEVIQKVVSPSDDAIRDQSGSSSSSSSITSVSSVDQDMTGLQDREIGPIMPTEREDEENNIQNVPVQEFSQVTLDESRNHISSVVDIGQTTAEVNQGLEIEKQSENLAHSNLGKSEEHEYTGDPRNEPSREILVSELAVLLDEDKLPSEPKNDQYSVEVLPNDATEMVTVDNDHEHVSDQNLFEETGEEFRIERDFGDNQIHIPADEGFNHDTREKQGQRTEGLDVPPEAPEMMHRDDEFQKPEEQSPEVDNDDRAGTVDQRTDNEDITRRIFDDMEDQTHIERAIDRSAELTTNDIEDILAPEHEQSVTRHAVNYSAKSMTDVTEAIVDNQDENQDIERHVVSSHVVTINNIEDIGQQRNEQTGIQKVVNHGDDVISESVEDALKQRNENDYQSTEDSSDKQTIHDIVATDSIGNDHEDIGSAVNISGQVNSEGMQEQSKEQEGSLTFDDKIVTYDIKGQDSSDLGTFDMEPVKKIQ